MNSLFLGQDKDTHALKLGASLLASFALLSIPFEWLDRDRADAYLRQFSLILVAVSYCGALLLLLLALFSNRHKRVNSAALLPIGATAIICMPMIVLLIVGDLGNPIEEYGRAHRDVFRYLWAGLLITSVPILLSSDLRQALRWTCTALAAGFVTGAYLLMMVKGFRGSRTHNEFLVFFAVLGLAIIIGRTVRRALSEKDSALLDLGRKHSELVTAHAQLEELHLHLMEEKGRYEQQSEAAIHSLRSMTASLEAVDKKRHRFISDAAHDLSQPLTAITLYADLLCDINTATIKEQVEKYASYIELIKSEAKALATAFNAILGYSNLESGLETVNIEPCWLADILKDISRRFTPIAEAQNMAFLVTMPNEAVILRTDRQLLLRALSNLVSNAIKHGGKKTDAHASPLVAIRVRRRGLLITIVVIDRGPGIPVDKRTLIFEPGYQINNSQRDRNTGYGLGLSTAGSILTKILPGHNIRLLSSEGRGCHFMVDIPIDFRVLTAIEEMPAALPTMGARPLDGALLLVVDDEDSIRNALCDLLKVAGAYVLSANSVKAAAQLVATCERHPDLVLTDYLLSGETGVDVIEVVRQACRRTIPAIILTASSQRAEDATTSMREVTIMKKPPDIDKLLHLLTRQYTPVPSPLEQLRPN